MAIVSVVDLPIFIAWWIFPVRFLLTFTRPGRHDKKKNIKHGEDFTSWMKRITTLWDETQPSKNMVELQGKLHGDQ
jgi:hypothetical protein